VRSARHTPSATSLPPSPHDDAGARSTRYLIMMGVRILCFVLMVLITPYGWYTAVFGAAAIFLPYIAVVTANVSQNVAPPRAENPERAIGATPPAPAPRETTATIIPIEETRAPESDQDDRG
jgi:endonuclease/exonuclease/phosphatase (EEP) superfamily protein YafD